MPRVLQTCLTIVRSHAQSLRPLALMGSMKSILPSTTTPRYSMCFCSNMHLEGQRKYDSLCQDLVGSWGAQRVPV